MKYASDIFNYTLLISLSVIFYKGVSIRPTVHTTAVKYQDGFEGRVKWVSDGDTILVTDHNFPVRIWGVDAPERDTQEGVASREFLKKAIIGKTAKCKKVVVDKYRRTVATCYVDGVDIAELMLNADHAKEYCSFTRGAYGRC